MSSRPSREGSAKLGELLSSWYYAADPNRYIVKTGMGIEDIKVMKSGWKHMFQNATVIDVSPQNYEFQLHAMSSETLPFILPGVFTIGPDIMDYDECLEDESNKKKSKKPKNELEIIIKKEESFASKDIIINNENNEKKKLSRGQVKTKNLNNICKYARFLASNNVNLRDNIIRGIIEGETRVLAATMTIKELFNGRTKFKEVIIDNINKELEQFGLVTRNANLKELVDTDGSTYFVTSRKKVISEVENQAKIDVANAQFKGESESKSKDTEKIIILGELDTKRETIIKEQEKNRRQQIAQLDAQASIAEKEQDKIKRQRLAEYDAEAIITEKDQESKKRKKLAELNANAITLENTQKEIETKSESSLLILRAQQEQLVKEAKLITEKQIELQNVTWEERNNQVKAKSVLEQLRATEYTKAQVNAEIVQKNTDTEVYAIKNKADATLYQKQKEAEGLQALNDVKIDKITKLIEAYNGNASAVLATLMIEDNIYTQLADSNAKAIQGLKPNITQWNTTSDGGNGSGINDLIRNITQMIPPLFKTIEDQSGVKILPTIIQTAAK